MHAAYMANNARRSSLSERNETVSSLGVLSAGALIRLACRTRLPQTGQ